MGHVLLGVAATSFPPSESSIIFAGILSYLGWNNPYTFADLAVAVDTYLQGSPVAQADWPWVHDNFLHTSMSHTDMLMAYYGAKVTFGTDLTTGLQTITYTSYP